MLTLQDIRGRRRQKPFPATGWVATPGPQPAWRRLLRLSVRRRLALRLAGELDPVGEKVRRLRKA